VTQRFPSLSARWKTRGNVSSRLSPSRRKRESFFPRLANFAHVQFLEHEYRNVSLNFRPHPLHGGRIWKRRFRSGNVSNVFRPHYAGGILKRNNHRSFWICVWRKLVQGNHMIIVTVLFPKSPFSFCFPFTRKRKAGLFRFFRFEERFRKAQFSWRIKFGR